MLEARSLVTAIALTLAAPEFLGSQQAISIEAGVTGDIGLSVSVPMGWSSYSWLIPHLGVTGIAMHEDRGSSGLLPGFGAGIGYLRATSAARGIRFDLTFRHYTYSTESTSNVLVLTAGLAWLQ